MRPLVSVIVPVYNAASYLDGTINSILNQTLRDIEIIIVDDGSTDNSRDIILKYGEKDDRIKIIYQENLGVSGARNNGINMATGEYIGFVDSDDKIEKNMYEKLYTTARKNNSDVVFCGMTIQTNYTKFTLQPCKKEIVVMDKVNIENEVYKSYIYSNKLCLAECCNKLYKLEVINKMNIKFDEKLKHGEDYLFNLEYMTHIQSAIFIPDNLYIYNRSNINSVTKNYISNLLDIAINIYNMKLKYSKLWNMEKYNNEIDRKFLDSVYGCIYNEVNSINNENRAIRLENIRKIQNNSLVISVCENLKSENLYVRLRAYILLTVNYKIIGVLAREYMSLRDKSKKIIRFIKCK